MPGCKTITVKHWTCPKLATQGNLLEQSYRTTAAIGVDGKVLEFDPSFRYGPCVNGDP